MTEQTATPPTEPGPEAAASAAEPGPTPAPAPVAPPMPLLPPAPPPAPAPPSPRPPRRALRAVARWTVAVLVFGAVGAGTAYGITSMERTDVPGLATEADGRWEYPRLTLPALPAGEPRPFSAGNPSEIHHADLRELLLPAPAGATEDKKLKGGWVGTEQFASEYAKDRRAGLGETLRDGALRHIAARGWTMPDGTSSRIYLLQFNSAEDADAFRDDRYIGASSAGDSLLGTQDLKLDESWRGGGNVENTASYVFSEPKPFGPAQVRAGYVVAGDTVALVVQSRKGDGGTPRVPFHQTVILQNQLLG
ncbi:hypothetical protein E6P78_29535 [Streptomyces sp. A0958]|uniref:hypothetical protein n=1 Tax=Streptomyces sp. A0958 TaxID=2563101 RepID=UPI00109EB4C0|nr:hypothetical protein [Streptomyces sp. A0958]THA59449.1 hypothetical protein E6P78_29535 [Streptomyces sp. A0958]